MDIKIFGTNTSGHQMVKSTIETFLNKADINYTISESSNVADFMKLMINSVPAVMIDDDEIFEIKSNGRFNSSLRILLQKLLRKENYGSLPKIIVPTDFSETAINAFNYAQSLAKEISGVIKIVHTYYPSSSDLNGNVFVDPGLRAIKVELLDDFVEALNKDWIGELMHATLIDKEFRDGFPVPSIIEVAKKSNASYIILGSTGEGETFKKFFGSISTEIVKQSPIPVILVPPNAEYKGFKKILYASADSELDKKCIEDVCTLAKKNNGNLHIIHVVDEDNGLDFNLVKMAESKLPKSCVEAQTLIAEDIPNAINQYAEENDIDLIVMSSKIRNFINKIFHKSVTKKMAMHSTIPLMILHPDE